MQPTHTKNRLKDAQVLIELGNGGVVEKTIWQQLQLGAGKNLPLIDSMLQGLSFNSSAHFHPGDRPRVKGTRQIAH